MWAAVLTHDLKEASAIRWLSLRDICIVLHTPSNVLHLRKPQEMDKYTENTSPSWTRTDPLSHSQILHLCLHWITESSKLGETLNDCLNRQDRRLKSRVSDWKAGRMHLTADLLFELSKSACCCQRAAVLGCQGLRQACQRLPVHLLLLLICKQTVSFTAALG